jgi:hypothetical protein
MGHQRSVKLQESMTSRASPVVLTLSKSSNHDPRIGPTSARLTLALVSLIEHVSQNIVVAVSVHVVYSYMPAIN